MASKCDRCGKSVAGYTYCGGCVGDNTPMPKQVPPKCPWCDEPIKQVYQVFDYRPDVNISAVFDENSGEYIERQEIGSNTDWHWEADCGHHVLHPADLLVGYEYAYDDSEYNPESRCRSHSPHHRYTEGFVAWATEVGITPIKPHAGLLDDLKRPAT